VDVNGECCQKSFPNGVPVTIILASGVKRKMTTPLVLLKKFSLNEDVLSDVENVLVDGGYSGDPFANGVERLLHCKVEVAKRSELHTFKVIPKRWVVERSFAWLEKCRRLWKNCERKLNTSLHMVIIAFAVLLVQRL
jgi:transposase